MLSVRRILRYVGSRDRGDRGCTASSVYDLAWNLLLRTRLQHLRHDHAGGDAGCPRCHSSAVCDLRKCRPSGQSGCHQRCGASAAASHLDPAFVQSLTPSPVPLVCGRAHACDLRSAGVSATPSICVMQNITVSNTGGTQQCGTSVSFKYPYGFNLPFQSFTLQMKAGAQMRAENQ